MSIKDHLKRIPGLAAAFRAVRGRGRATPFSGSTTYWEQRYADGGSSGAGSYNRLAAFKADFLNAFVEENAVQTVLEFGCGDGAQLALARYPRYCGVDVSETAVALCSRRFASDPTKRFYVAPGFMSVTAELGLSLDVVYHLVEDEVFHAYMDQLFQRSERFVIIYSSNEDRPFTSEHVRHRRFTDWVEREQREWTLVRVEKNRFPYDPADEGQTSFADFYVYARQAAA